MYLGLGAMQRVQVVDSKNTAALAMRQVGRRDDHGALNRLLKPLGFSSPSADKALPPR